MYNFTVIIPQRNSLNTLPKLLSSIPNRSDIEVIVVDNSPIPITKTDIKTDRVFTLLWASPDRYAGGARNEGVKQASGKWLIFADADDYFSENAFDVFTRYLDSDAELIYFCCDGVYTETGEHAIRGDKYSNLVRGYLNGSKSEKDLRFCFPVPWSKMVRRELVVRESIQYDEVVASNDALFSLLTGYYAKKIDAVDEIVYVVTVSKGTLTKRMDKNAIMSRFQVNLRYNKFMKEHGLSSYQKSIMNYLFILARLGVKPLCECCKLLIKYRQNPFVGSANWVTTTKKLNFNMKNDKRYYTN